MAQRSMEEERSKAERLKVDCRIDEWLLEEALRTSQPKPMFKIKTKFDPTVRDLLIEIVDKYVHKR